MCLVALALGQSRRFPLVLASNRDEFFDRPSAPLGWWSPGAAGPLILGGRDLQAGGSWFGLEPGGRLALVTNVRDPQRVDPKARSRGELVTRWLCGTDCFDDFWNDLEASRYNGFNLVAADLRQGDWVWASNGGAAPLRLTAGIYGLSNAGLDTAWPKVVRLEQRLKTALSGDDTTVEALADQLFKALADPALAADAELPATGIPLELERLLSPAFIRTPDGRYGTRCSTLLIQESAGGRLRTHVLERNHAPAQPGSSTLEVTLEDWPAVAPQAAVRA